MNERELITFSEDIANLDPMECEIRAIELVNYLESNSYNIEDYKYLHFYAKFNGLLNESNFLKEEYKDSHNSEENVSNIEVLNEASTANSSISAKRVKITKLILDSIALVDRSKLNVNKYKNLLQSMSDVEFKKYMDDFTTDPDKNFYLEILPNKSEPTITDIENLLVKLKVPKEEYVYYRHDGNVDDPIRSREECSVG